METGLIQVLLLSFKMLHIVQPGIAAVQVHQLGMRALLGNPAVLQHDDLIGVRNR